VFCCLPGNMGGERLATDNRQLGYTRWKAFPSDRVPSLGGEGTEAEVYPGGWSKMLELIQGPDRRRNRGQN
jgi:hypothetical protein